MKLKLIIISLFAVVIGGGLFVASRRASLPVKASPPVSGRETAKTISSEPVVSQSRPATMTASFSTSNVVAPIPAGSPPVESVHSSRELISELSKLTGFKSPITAEQAAKFKANLDELIRRGASAVPAIREFLGKNLDNEYNENNGGDQLSYSSLRAALFDTLKQIGGPEAQGAMLEALQTSAVPAELLDLATDLEREAPGQYRDDILKAAREALEMAAANQLGSNVETGPAYRILNTYGEAGSLEDGPKHDAATLFSAIAMANLPDGQGIPSLVQMAQNASPEASGRILATEMIAQLAGQNLQAFDALMQMAQQQQISNRVWTRLAPILGGDEYQILQDSGGPNYAIVNGATSADQINQRITLIDRFLGVVSQDSAAAAALLHERGILAARLRN